MMTGSFTRTLRVAAFTLSCLLIAGFLAGCGGSSKPVSITVTSSASTVDPTDTATMTATVVNDKGADGVTWTISGGGTLSNTTTTGATFTAPAASASSLSVTVTATSVADTSKTASVTIAVPAAPSITTSTLPQAAVGTQFSESLTVSGGVSPYTWTVSSGTLPSCLTLTPAGVLSGTPTAACAGTYNVTFKVTDSGAPTPLTATEALTITINGAQAIVLPAPASLPAGVFNTAYTGSVGATGGAGALTYTLTGSLPTGLTLNASSGAITGTPTATGTFTFTIQAADAFGDSASQAYSITVTYPTLSITTTSLAAGLYNTTYSPVTLAATGGSESSANLTWTWAAASGSSLPAGLSLSTAGVISGKPTAAGSFSVVITVADSVSKTNASVTLPIAITYPTLSITTSSLPNGVLNAAYPSTTLAATGGSGSSANDSWTWAAASGSSLPAGLNLSTAGVISGTPTAGGSFSVVVTVADSVSKTNATATLPITITYPTLTISTASLPNGTLNATYSPVTLAATGGSDSTANYSWTWAAASGSSLPAGLNLSTAGVISGTPTAGGSFSVIITVADSVSKTNATATLPITITYPTLTITTSSLPNGILNTAYSPVTLAATGGSDSTANYSWTWAAAASSSLPPGMSLSTAGVLSGTPTSGGSYSVVITVADSVSKTSAQATLPFNIGFTTLVISTNSLPAGLYNTTYGPVTLAGTGGSGNSANYTWTWAAAPTSSLPAGLSLSSAGVISGKPTATGSFSVVVTLADSVSKTNTTATLSISVTYAALSITTASPLPSGVINATYTPVTLAATGGSGSSANYSWTWAAASGSSLPAGLSLSTAGVISGKPTAAGTSSVVVTVADSVSSTSAQATLSIVINASLAITTTTLPSATTGAAYSQQLASSGGSGGNTWSTTGTSNLSTFNLTLSAAGLIQGTPTATGTASFTAQVKDSNGDVATEPLTIAVYGPLALSPSTLPGGTTGLSYNQTITATGGSGSYSLTVTGLSDGLSDSISGANVNIGGTPTSATTVSFTVTVKDTVTSATVGPISYSIAVTNPAALSLPAPNPSSLPSATVNAFYNGSVNANGGAGTYTWTVNGNVLSGGTTTSLGNGNLGVAANGNSLTITGTPNTLTTTGSPISFTASVADSAGQSTATQDYTIAVNNAGAEISGTIALNLCNNGGNQPAMTVSINTTPVQTTTTDSSGNFSFASVPNGTYTITPSSNAPSSIFFPATQSVTVTGSPVSTSFNANLGYTVSGNVTFGPTTPTGQVYVAMSNNNCGGGGTQGTSITEATLTSGGAFTIRGVSPGSYTLNAFMDTLGKGNPNAADPSGSTSNLTVSGANLSGVAITLTNPGTVTLTSAPSISGVSPFSTGALVQYNAVKNNGVEAATSYTLQWSTSSTFATVTGSQTFPANGTHTNVWFVNGLTNSNVLYFRVYGTSAGTATGPNSAIVGPITIGAPTGGNTVSGAVTFTGTATGPMYTGFYNQNTNQFYGEYIVNPVSPQNYSVQVPSGSGYQFVAVLDQNKNGIIDVGDIQNTDNGGNGSGVLLSITGSLSNEDLTLPSAGSTAYVSTQVSENSGPGGGESYSLSFAVDAAIKLPVSVTLQPSSNADGANVVAPMDIASCAVNGSSCGQGFQIYVNLDNVAPKAGDTYSFAITYSDGTTGTVSATVSSVLSAFATNLSPSGTGVSVTPNFSWTDPANAGNYTYSFSLSDNNGNQIWQIPGNNSNSNGFSSSITSLTWGTDPTGGGSTPTVTSLSGNTNYYWQIQVQDANGNQSTASANFTTSEAPVSLPAANTNPFGSAVVGTFYSYYVNASGGSGHYSFTVNGTVIPTNGTFVAIPNGDGLSAANTGNGTLTVSGTPTAPETVSLAVEAADSSNTSDTASVTYSLPVNATSSTNNSYLDGSYAFYGGGWVDGTTQANTQRKAVIGNFIADGNGNITSGVMDINQESGVTTNASITGTYAIGSSNTGLLTLHVGGSSNTTLIAVSLGTITSNIAGAGSFIEYDDAGGIGTAGGSRLSGSFALQDPTKFSQAKLDGSYAFGENGSTCSALDSGCSTTATAYGPLSIAGVATFNGSGSITSGEEDVAVGFKQYSAVTLSGAYGTPSATTGRVTGTLSTTGIDSNELTLWPTNYVYYIISSGHFYAMSIDSHAQYAGMIGQFVEQDASSFTASDFNGNFVGWESTPDTNYVTNFGTSNETSTSQASIYLLSVASGTASVNEYQNSNGTYSTNTIGNAGTASVASNGRVTITGGSGNAPVFYLYAANSGFATETTGPNDHPGLLYFTPQSAGPFSTSTLSGAYVVSGPLPVMETGAESSIVTATGANLAIVGYKSSASGSLTVENKTDTITVNSTTGLVTTPDGSTGVIISPTEWIIMDTTSTNPVIKFLQQ